MRGRGLTDEERIARYDVNAPRYTSYPTAAQFTPAVGAADRSRWLAGLPQGRPVSLYLHIPFCKRLETAEASIAGPLPYPSGGRCLRRA